ncbi:MAG TPA: methyltransferase domain-containing protein [Verrucomicrobiae bacterium]|nr:methyltransferase domain-containing protein [Verrucomicrobiae bacterium]
MFFPRRATQVEYFDSPDRTHSELVEGYASLNRVNQWFIFADPFQRSLPRLLGEEQCRELSILDLGAGDGLLGRTLERWASNRGWKWKFTNLDVNPGALALNPGARNVVGSALALPFDDRSFDVVIGSQMTHHFSDEEVVIHLREAWRVARLAICLTDLQRSALLYLVVRMMFLLARFPGHFQQDGLLSVKRGFRMDELQRFAEAAKISSPQVFSYYGMRLILQAKKV